MEDTARSFADRPAPWDYTLGPGRACAGRPSWSLRTIRDIREMLATLLDLAGFAAVTRDGAEAGLNALREQAFDVILTDYALPRHSGLWFLHAGRNRRADSAIPRS